MQKSTLAFLSIIILSSAAHAQLFENRIGKSDPREFGNSVTQQVDNSFLIGCNYRNTFYGKDFPAVIHLKPNGSVDWVRQLNLPNSPSCIVQYAEAVRSTTGTADGYIALLNASPSIYLVRLTNTGTVSWARKLSNAAYSSNYPLRVKPVYSSATSLPSFYILATHFSGLGEMIIKTNSTGAIVWQKRLTHPTSGYSFVFRDMQATKDSGCVVTGYVSGGGTSKTVIFKFSSTGFVSLAKSYDFFSTTSAGGFGISEVSNGDLVVTGNDGGSDDNLTFKVNSIGAVIWAYKYTNATSNDIGGQAVVTDAAGNIIVAAANYPGATSNPSFLMKLNSSGSVLFSKEYDDFSGVFNTYNDADINDLKLTNKGYCFVGTASPSNVLSDIFIVQTNTSGNVTGSCTPTTATISRLGAEFFVAASTSYLVLNEALTNTAITVTSPKITTQELRCATALTGGVEEEAATGTLTAYAIPNSGNVRVEYKLKTAGNMSYEVKLLNLNGDVMAASTLKANQPMVLNSKPLQNGMYVVSLSNKGVNITKQKIMIGQ